MSKKNDWNEINDYEKQEKENIVKQYGFDIREIYKKNNSKDSIKKRNIAKKLIKVTIIILILILIIDCIFSFIRFSYKRTRRIALEDVYGIKFEEYPEKTDITNNGFLIYKTEKIPDMEIHAISKLDYTFIEDTESRIYKYYFEKWQDKDKSKFNIEENYDDYTYAFTTKKNWILNYKTYININTYEELINATELIIKFKNYMPFQNIIIKSYIQFNNKLILPHNTSNQTDDEIRKSSEEQYNRIINEKNI